MGKAHITADLRLPTSWANQKTSRLAENSTGKPKETTMSLDEHIFWRHFLKGMLGYLCTWSWWDPWEGSSYLYISKALHTHAHVPCTSMHMYAKHTLVHAHTHTHTQGGNTESLNEVKIKAEKTCQLHESWLCAPNHIQMMEALIIGSRCLSVNSDQLLAGH